ncbi:MAG: phosphate acyltransferase PlsX [Candidatus Kaelpia aquatica]|nr:phosphate acyltransferase PlsX [Candidatus Kaelpia aquatica]
MKAKIAIDAMGGDFAPAACVQGAQLALEETPNIEIYLVGRSSEISSLIKGRGDGIYIVDAKEVITMDEAPALSVRRKKDSSINRAMGMLKNREADVFIGAGNTGAVVCAATMILRTLPGVERPGIAIIFPTVKGFSLMIDVGANIDPKPLHLFQYGLMGAAYAELILDKKNPSLGLLNIGEEESKGTEFMKIVNTLLKEGAANYIGNIEGRDIFFGKCDVVVADGFVGNVALKVSESVAMATAALLKKHIKQSILSRLGALLMLPALKKMKRDMDYTEYGGAPLLGVDGNVIICHGSSSSKAIKNSIKVAKEMVDIDLREKIRDRIASVQIGEIR